MGLPGRSLVRQPNTCLGHQDNNRSGRQGIRCPGTVVMEYTEKSKYYNKKDFALAKKAILEMKQAKWPNAIKTAKKAKDKSIYNFIQWRHLLTKGNKATFYEYKTFIDKNEDFPRIGRVK